KAVFFALRPCSFSRRTLSRVRASRKMATKGPLPDRKTLYSSLVLSMCLVAIFRPTNVLPAPGTPVTKQIAFLELALALLMMSEIASDVSVKLTAVASFREMSATEWPLYREVAASMMVGVGQ